MYACPENHVEIWLAFLFLSRAKFHAKQICVLSSSRKLGLGSRSMGWVRDGFVIDLAWWATRYAHSIFSMPNNSLALSTGGIPSIEGLRACDRGGAASSSIFPNPIPGAIIVTLDPPLVRRSGGWRVTICNYPKCPCELCTESIVNHVQIEFYNFNSKTDLLK